MKILLNKCRHEKRITLEKLAGLAGISSVTCHFIGLDGKTFL